MLRCCICLFAGALAFFLCVEGGYRLRTACCTPVSQGMTRDEVGAVLGKPRAFRVPYRGHNPEYYRGRTPFGYYECIEVDFDDENCVAHWAASYDPPDRPGWLDAVLTPFGW